MSSNSGKYPHGCFLPMNALSVHPQGHSHFCLTSTLPAAQNLEQLNQNRQDVHQTFLRGEWPDSCKRCLNKENKGLESRRLRTWSRKEKIYGAEASVSMVTSANAPSIRHLDISFSNSCNLSCAICSSEFSTGWIKHDKRARDEGLEFRDFTTPYKQVGKMSDELFAEVMEQIESIDLILIKGGEPTKEPRCLEFLKGLAEKQSHTSSIFIQTNGTSKPEKWLNGLENLSLDIGISMDGWGEVFNWVRGPYFDEVLANIRELDKRDNIKSLTIDFTLSSFNLLHLPTFLEKILTLKKELKKIKHCPVFQWVQQPYGNPLTIPLDIRLDILSKASPLLDEGSDFFLDSHFLKALLQRPRAAQKDIDIAIKWFDYMKSVRGYSLGETESLLAEALLSK